MYSYEEALKTSMEYFQGSELSAKVFVDKYALRDKENNLLESNPDQMHRRLAKEFARIEAAKFKKPYTEDFIYNLFKNYSVIIPQGSPIMGIGNPYSYVTLSNCYVLTTPEDSYNSILMTDRELVNISKRRGGVGINLSKLRPAGSSTNNAARTSTGIESWMERYSNSIREVAQNGRRGALMLTLSVHHPDIETFITIKNDKTKVTGANISVMLTDEFLNAVKKNEEFELRFPVDSSTPTISKKVNAKKIWDLIIKNAHVMAEPGLLFWDNIIKESPADCYKEQGFETKSTNPCCLSQLYDAYVVTSNGIKEIKEVTNHDLIWINENKTWAKTTGYFNAGLANIYKVCFKNGAELYITNNHKLCTIKSKRLLTKIDYTESDLVELSKLKIGDKIALHNTTVDDSVFGKLGSYNEGLILGWMTGDGCLSYHDEDAKYPSTILDFWPNEFDTANRCLEAFDQLGYQLSLIDNKTNNNKRIRSEKFTELFVNKYEYNIWSFKSETKSIPFLFKASKEFIIGFLRTYFAADGTVQVNHDTKDYNIQLSSINKNRLNQIRYILNLFGIKSSIGLAKKAGESEFINGGKYQTKDCWRITLTGITNIIRFYNLIGIENNLKHDKLLDILNTFRARNNDKNSKYTEIKSIELIGQQPVGCIEVDKYHKFTVNGIISGNSEIPLSELDSCRLMAINLFSCVINPFEKDAKYDYKLLYLYSEIAQRLMDDLIDLELECIDKILSKIKKDPEPEEIKREEYDLWYNIRQNCVIGRRTGLGPTVLGDTLAALGIKYGSNESIETVEEIYKTLKFGAYQSSVDIAKELGPFLCWDKELEKDNLFLNRFKEESIEYGTTIVDGIKTKGYLWGEELYKDIRKHGRRNICLLTTAPTGTISTQASMKVRDKLYFNTTAGIEPLFKTHYTRRKKGNPGDKNFHSDFVDQKGDHWQEFEVYHSGVQAWMDITGKDKIDKTCPYFNCTAEEINWVQRVKLQAAAQKHIDHAISSTINLPEDVTEEEVAKIYETAWKSGLKGITVYRANCRTGVLIEKKDTKRPKELPCAVHHVTVKNQQYLVLVGMMNGKPYETFACKNGILDKNIKTGKIIKIKNNFYKAVFDDETELSPITASCSEHEETISRLTSLALRTGTDYIHIIDQLNKVQGDMTSYAKCIARVLKKYVKDGTTSLEDCPECKTKLVFNSGCTNCVNCGYSKCS